MTAPWILFLKYDDTTPRTLFHICILYLMKIVTDVIIIIVYQSLLLYFQNESADEFDFMLYPKMKAISVFNKGYPPGYCKVKVMDKTGQFKEITDADNYIDPSKYKEKAFRLFDEISSRSRRITSRFS